MSDNEEEPMNVEETEEVVEAVSLSFYVPASVAC